MLEGLILPFRKSVHLLSWEPGMESFIIIPQKRTNFKATPFDFWGPTQAVEICDLKLQSDLKAQEATGIECVDKDWFCHYKFLEVREIEGDKLVSL